MFEILILSIPFLSIYLEFLNLKGWFTTYFASAIPYLISISLLRCIISEDRNLATTITKTFPGFILNGGTYSIKNIWYVTANSIVI